MQPGDTVRLKSGGPLMTIRSKSRTDGWICAWWNEKASKFEEETFPEVAIEAAKSSPTIA